MGSRDTGNWLSSLDAPVSSRTRQRNLDTSNITSDDRFKQYGGASGRHALENRRVTSLVGDIIKQPPSTSIIREVRKEAVKEADTADDIVAITKAFSDIEAYRSEVYGRKFKNGSNADSYIKKAETKLQTNLVEEALSHPPLRAALEKLANHAQRSEARESSPAISQTQDIHYDQASTVKAESPGNVVITPEDEHYSQILLKKVQELPINELNQISREIQSCIGTEDRQKASKAVAVLRLIRYQELSAASLAHLRRCYPKETETMTQPESKATKKLLSQSYTTLKSSLKGKNLENYPTLKAIRDVMSSETEL